MKDMFDVLVIGPVSMDHNIDHMGKERKEMGGAVVASGFAAAGSGSKTAVFTKLNSGDANVQEIFRGSGVRLYWEESVATCFIRNQYFTADKEKRSCHSLGVCDPFRFEEFSHIPTRLYHFAGLVAGDFSGEVFVHAAEKGKVAVDVQCLLRHVETDGTMGFHDWKEKKKYLPYIDYFKTDAAEAAILTGVEDRQEAARMIHGWGTREVMITHNTEVLVYDGKSMYTCPIKARNLSGRTGRGDTAFAGYITERAKADVEEALCYSTALVSLKMETPGPFRGSREEVMEYRRRFY
ncbi:MAG: ribokinase [Lachnospiraceae bacterium]|nr:ribokinase [Lachnospiraceae bacterium]